MFGPPRRTGERPSFGPEDPSPDGFCIDNAILPSRSWRETFGQCGQLPRTILAHKHVCCEVPGTAGRKARNFVQAFLELRRLQHVLGIPAGNTLPYFSDLQYRAKASATPPSFSSPWWTSTR